MLALTATCMYSLLLLTSTQIIHQRVKPHLVRNQQMWNRYPGGLAYDTTYGTSLRDFPFLSPHLFQPSAEAGYTVVIRASMEVTPSSPLSQLIASLGKCWRLKKVCSLMQKHGLITGHLCHSVLIVRYDTWTTE